MPYENQPPAEETSSPEHQRPVFNLEQLEPDQVADFASILGAASDAESAAHRDHTVAEPFINLFEQSLNRLARTSDKAVGVYTALVSSTSSEWPPYFAAEQMASALLQRQREDPEVRDQVIMPLIRMLHEATGLAKEAAKDTLENLVYADWLDEQTARGLNEQLPDHWRRW